MKIIRNKRDVRDRPSALEDVLRCELSAQRVLRGMLRNTSTAVSELLRVECNARYFSAVLVRGSIFLVQARDLHVENLRMPTEHGFTRVPVDDAAFVSSRSYLTRASLFEELPADHTKILYSPESASMVDRRQRWVMACPVLPLDGLTGDLQLEGDPHGVLVFYGIDMPEGDGVEARVREGLSCANEAADTFSGILEIGDAVGGLAVDVA